MLAAMVQIPKQKNPDGQPIAQVTDEYQTLIIQLPDDRFSALSDVGFAENMLIRNIGAYEKTLYIDEILFHQHCSH